MFLVVVIVYVIINFLIFVFLYMYFENNRFWRYFISDLNFEVFNLVLFLLRIYFINNIVNFFIYGYFDLIFRKEVKVICVSIIVKLK